jgi:SAM-dependent methyltransferase
METTTTRPLDPHLQGEEPWQLHMFRRSLKKQQKLNALLGVLGPLENQDCVLITCGDNNGALNWHFKQHGGRWTWVDAEEDSLEQIHEVTGDPVLVFPKEEPRLSFEDNMFNIVITIDVHEHLKNPESINRELFRIARPHGKVIVTTPAGNQKKLANRIKGWVGMTKEDYGHYVDGYDAPELEQQLREVGLIPYKKTSYSRFFTELVELAINLAFVKVLGNRKKVDKKEGQIAPQNKEQVKSVEKTLKIYAFIYPLILAFSKLDSLIKFRSGYAAVVAARKE